MGNTHAHYLRAISVTAACDAYLRHPLLTSKTAHNGRMNDKLHVHWRRDRATGFHCGKCGQTFTPVLSLGDQRSPYQQIVKAFETHDCVPQEAEDIERVG